MATNDDKIKNMIHENAKEEREQSDEKYAIKLVEKIVFWGVALLAGAVLIVMVDIVKLRFERGFEPNYEQSE